MKVEHDDHDGYARIGKTIYGSEDARRWSDRCRCGGTRADHIRPDPEMLGLRVANVSNNNHNAGCGQFVPSKTPYFSNIKTVIESETGTEMITDDANPNPKIKVEGRPPMPSPDEIKAWRDSLEVE